jgi:hypothetical protein
MRIKMNTTMAHPKHGVAHAGQIIDLPEAAARPMLEGGHADPVDQKVKPAAEPVVERPAIGDGGETASLEGAPETGMQAKARPRK